ncbi:Rrf2 family transcriptional regulator [Myxococcota bacterium]|jgi:Rrf2 family protein|nr:Rrf2 family transcriptional regulator [Myxococcota bacterium]PKN24640.1 MAG: AsnC family transcriptional regulator [Deltaproteobacteria bacterium HGW-Deltaproteobacteria-22]
MRISTKGRYGLRIMLELALRHGQGPVLADLIERSQGISGKYVHQLMPGLRHAGLVRTVRGPHGGYELARSPDEITVLEIITVLEGPPVPVECVAQPGSCERTGVCVTHELWREVATAIEDVLSQATLGTLCRRQRERGQEPLSFSI